jgi:hypothetical protein
MESENAELEEFGSSGSRVGCVAETIRNPSQHHTARAWRSQTSTAEGFLTTKDTKNTKKNSSFRLWVSKNPDPFVFFVSSFVSLVV